MTDSPAPFTAACVQMRSGRDPIANRDAMTALVREAAQGGAAYVQTPEMTSLVVRDRAELFAKTTSEDLDPTLSAAREIARELGIMLHLGSIAVQVGEKIANRALVIGPDGDILGRYDKIHLFDVDLPNGESWRESATYTGGEIATLVETRFGLIGLSICYDVRFAYLYRAQAQAGAFLLSAPACFTKQTGEAHWQVLHRARAIETGSFMISAAQAGTHEDGRETWGHSIIVDPWGRVLAEAEREPGVILATIDPGLSADARGRIPTLKHTRAFKVAASGTPAKPQAAE